MRRCFTAINAMLARPAAGWALLVLVLVLYGVAYRTHELYPGTGGGAAGRGWWTWSDQGKYLAEAGAIAELRLDARTYAYPVGYPALGALFWRWMPAHPFLLPNLLLVAGYAACWWRLARRWFSPVAALAVGALFLATHRWLFRDTMVVPWNTLPTQLTLLAGVWTIIAVSGVRAVIVTSALAAATYLVRPIDVVPFVPLVASAVLQLPDWRRRLGWGLGALAVVGVALAAIAGINLAIFGHWRTPYEYASTQLIGFFSYPISYKCFWLLVDGRPLFRETDPALLFRYPWLFLAFPAAAFWVRRDGQRALAALAAIGASWFVYLNYNDFLPSDVYRFTLIHYLAWSFPLLFLAACAAVRCGWRSTSVRLAGAVAVAGFLLCAGLRMDEQPLPAISGVGGEWMLPPARPLLVRFRRVPLDAAPRLRLDARPLVEYYEYLAPYVGPDLQILLSPRRAGSRLSVTGDGPGFTPPETAEYVWRWRWNPGRMKRLCR